APMKLARDVVPALERPVPSPCRGQRWRVASTSQIAIATSSWWWRPTAAGSNRRPAPAASRDSAVGCRTEVDEIGGPERRGGACGPAGRDPNPGGLRFAPCAGLAYGGRRTRRRVLTDRSGEREHGLTTAKAWSR